MEWASGVLFFLSVVHSLDGAPEFVSPVYEKGNCFALRFNWHEVKTHCRAIQIATETDSFLYAQLISTGEEAFNFSNAKCGNDSLNAKTIVKEPTMVEVNICGYPANMCLDACQLDVRCQRKESGLTAHRKKFNISHYMCPKSEEDGPDLEDPSTNCCDCAKNKCKDLSRTTGLGISLLLSLLVNLTFLIRCVISYRSHFFRRLRKRLLRIQQRDSFNLTH